MRKIFYSMTALAALGGMSAAHAGDEAAAVQAEAAVAADAAAVEADAAAVEADAPAVAADTDAAARSFSDAEIDSFAAATIAASEINADATLTAEEKPEALIAAVEANGIDAETYNAIAQALQTDAALGEKVSTAIAARSSASESDS